MQQGWGLVCSGSPTFWPQDPFTLLKITEASKELCLMWIITIDICHIKNKLRKHLMFIKHYFKTTNICYLNSSHANMNNNFRAKITVLSKATME